MSLLDDIKAKLDTNQDGRVSRDDLEALKNGDQDRDTKIEELKSHADQTDDGKLSFDDIKNFDFGGMIDNLKKKVM
ncbi:MAG TPA: EF-hand domain-containing protein [Candidatus Saccharimonadales bacterium]|nr:EF-hand domain-containing protein [Candidatus Saccharimonadales bacterium]